MSEGSLLVNEDIAIPHGELELKFIRASGPGGQSVNKVSSAVQLRFNINSSPSLPEDIKERLKKLGGKRVTYDGDILIEAKRFRSQDKNREDALRRLAELIRSALEKPKKRKKTRPSVKSKERRLKDKRMISNRKKHRKPVRDFDD